MIVLDSSGLFAALNPDETLHRPVLTALERESPPFLLSPFVLAEIDYLTLTRGGVRPELALLDAVAAEQYELTPFSAEDVGAARSIVAQYDDIAIGLADASIVVLAGRYETDRVLTLDERHFRTLRTHNGRPFILLPADC